MQTTHKEYQTIIIGRWGPSAYKTEGWGVGTPTKF